MLQTSVKVSKRIQNARLPSSTFWILNSRILNSYGARPLPPASHLVGQ